MHCRAHSLIRRSRRGHASLNENPRRRPPGFRFSAEVGWLWPEVALHAQQTAPHALVGRDIESRRTVAGAAEVEIDAARIHVLVELRGHHFDADIQVLHWVPHGTGTHPPDFEGEVAARHRAESD